MPPHKTTTATMSWTIKRKSKWKEKQNLKQLNNWMRDNKKSPHSFFDQNYIAAVVSTIITLSFIWLKCGKINFWLEKIQHSSLLLNSSTLLLLSISCFYTSLCSFVVFVGARCVEFHGFFVLSSLLIINDFFAAVTYLHLLFILLLNW